MKLEVEDEPNKPKTTGNNQKQKRRREPCPRGSEHGLAGISVSFFIDLEKNMVFF